MFMVDKIALQHCVILPTIYNIAYINYMKNKLHAPFNVFHHLTTIINSSFENKLLEA